MQLGSESCLELKLLLIDAKKKKESINIEIRINLNGDQTTSLSCNKLHHCL
jgi:hypothetical protein